MTECEKLLGISVRRIEGKGIKDAITELITKDDLKFAILGNRRGDPWSDEIGELEPSSPGWPDFVRVHPVLEWSYHEVWGFLRNLELPYCSLYDEGYTSLGTIARTQKNPALQQGEDYSPAYMLKLPEDERRSRVA